MTDYSLAKQLRGAGFPQHPQHGTGCYWTPEGYVYKSEDEIPKKYKNVWFLNPTLTELIEACGEKFYALERYHEHTWTAHERYTSAHYDAKTPEEAVAQLWLALHSTK